MILTTEIYWLTLTVLMTALMWVPYIINRMAEQGVFKAVWDPQGKTKTNRVWADRMMRAHENAVENLVVFAPLVLIVQLLSLNTSTTAIACITFFFARAIHFVVFTFGIPILRVITFAVGFVAQMVLGLNILQII